MTISPVLFSSNKEDWETPQDLFDELHEEFQFTLDAAASKENTKCTSFYTKEDDALKQIWHPRTFCNPPYSRKVGHWIKKAFQESQEGCLVVMLLPARTSTPWFHKYIYKQPSVETRFLKGRLHFSNSIHGAPFPSMIVIFRPPS